MKGHFDQHNGEYYMRNEKLYNNQDRSDTLSIKSEGRSQISFMNNNRMYMYCPFVNHPGLNKCQYKSFFQKCRVSGISFDIEKKIGSTFVLLDSLQSGVISIMSIATKKDQLIKYMNDVLMFIVLQGGSQNIKYVDNSDISRTDQLTFNDVISKIRTMYKHNQRSSSSNHNAPLSNQIYTSFQL